MTVCLEWPGSSACVDLAKFPDGCMDNRTLRCTPRLTGLHKRWLKLRQQWMSHAGRGTKNEMEGEGGWHVLMYSISTILIMFSGLSS